VSSNEEKRIDSTVRIKLSDLGCAALWSAEDANWISRQFQLIRVNRDKERAVKFEHLLKRRDEGQTAIADDGFRVEPLTLSFKWDLLTNNGLARIAELATADSTQYFSHFAAGTDDSDEKKGDFTLGEEVARVDIFNSGYQTGAGTSMRFAGFFNTGFETNTIAEGGVFDDEDAGTMLFRTRYSVPLNHVQYSTVFTLTQTIILQALEVV
jgi:hypothetical protein